MPVVRNSSERGLAPGVLDTRLHSAARIERAEVASLPDQPLGVVAVGEVADGVAELVDGDGEWLDGLEAVAALRDAPAE